MKYFCLFILHFTICTASAQTISLQYIKSDGTASARLPVSEKTRTLIIDGVKVLTKFDITVAGLKANHKIILLDDTGTPLGNTITADGKKAITSVADLANVAIKIIHEDDQGVKKVFAEVLFQVLPKAKLDMIGKITGLTTLTGKVCEPCPAKGNAIKYDFSQRSFSYDKNIKFLGINFSNGRPVVGEPYSFSVININPFRDSVIISSETIDFNTEVPALFNQAFFSAAQQALNTQQTAILADVIELGEQLKRIKATLKDAKECADICEVIQQVKDQTESYFTGHGFDPKTTDLITFILTNLDGINPLYREQVIEVLNDYRNFYNTKNYFRYDIPKVQNVDQYIFNLSVLPKSGAQSFRVIDHQPIPVNTVGGFKFDFSSGLFVTNLLDDHYHLKPDSTVIRNSYGGDSLVFNKRHQIIQQNDDKKLDFGVSALMHFYPRITTNVNIKLIMPMMP